VPRNWEGKSLQSLIDSAKARSGDPKISLTPEQLEVEKKLDSFLLHRTRVVKDLEACHDGRRETLSAGLAYLDSQIAALSPKP
jgi:hypothetical protein